MYVPFDKFFKPLASIFYKLLRESICKKAPSCWQIRHFARKSLLNFCDNDKKSQFTYKGMHAKDDVWTIWIASIFWARKILLERIGDTNRRNTRTERIWSQVNQCYNIN